MCIICVEFQKQLITIQETRRILAEMHGVIEPKHLLEIEEMLKEEREYDDT